MKFMERLLDEQPVLPPKTELEPDDLRLEEATAAAVRGEYLRAAQTAEEVFASGVYDARLLGYLLLGTLIERGPSSLGLVLRATTGAVVRKRLAFTPERRREVLLDGVLHWFLTHVVRQLELSEKLGDGQWEAWEQALAGGDLDEVFATVERLLPVLAELTPRAKSPQPLLRLAELLRQMRPQRAGQSAGQSAGQRAGRTEPAAVASLPSTALPPTDPAALPPDLPPAPVDLDPEPVVSAPPSSDHSASERMFRPTKATTRESGLPGFATESTLYASESLLRLATNMQRFGTLVAQGNHLHAAVVGAELQRELKRFDPSIYLPKLVTPFLRQLAESCDDLEPYFAQRDSLRFQTLAKLFRADPEGFSSAADPSTSDGE